MPVALWAIQKDHRRHSNFEPGESLRQLLSSLPIFEDASSLTLGRGCRGLQFHTPEGSWMCKADWPGRDREQGKCPKQLGDGRELSETQRVCLIPNTAYTNVQNPPECQPGGIQTLLLGQCWEDSQKGTLQYQTLGRLDCWGCPRPHRASRPNGELLLLPSEYFWRESCLPWGHSEVLVWQEFPRTRAPQWHKTDWQGAETGYFRDKLKVIWEGWAPSPLKVMLMVVGAAKCKLCWAGQESQESERGQCWGRPCSRSKLLGYPPPV